MTRRVRALYKIARNDKEFLRDIAIADGDKAPGFFTDEDTECGFVLTYYGWLVGNGRWKQVKDQIPPKYY